MKQLEKELTHTSGSVKPEQATTDVISIETRSLFEDCKQCIKDLPVFDTDTFMRIQAFEWLLMATSLIQGQSHKNVGTMGNSADKA